MADKRFVLQLMLQSLSKNLFIRTLRGWKQRFCIIIVTEEPKHLPFTDVFSVHTLQQPLLMTLACISCQCGPAGMRRHFEDRLVLLVTPTQQKHRLFFTFDILVF